jgi:hypothetical protein
VFLVRLDRLSNQRNVLYISTGHAICLSARPSTLARLTSLSEKLPKELGATTAQNENISVLTRNISACEGYSLVECGTVVSGR